MPLRRRYLDSGNHNQREIKFLCALFSDDPSLCRIVVADRNPVKTDVNSMFQYRIDRRPAVPGICRVDVEIKAHGAHFDVCESISACRLRGLDRGCVMSPPDPLRVCLFPGTVREAPRLSLEPSDLAESQTCIHGHPEGSRV